MFSQHGNDRGISYDAGVGLPDFGFQADALQTHPADQEDPVSLPRAWGRGDRRMSGDQVPL